MLVLHCANYSVQLLSSEECRAIFFLFYLLHAVSETFLSSSGTFTIVRQSALSWGDGLQGGGPPPQSPSPPLPFPELLSYRQGGGEECSQPVHAGLNNVCFSGVSFFFTLESTTHVLIRILTHLTKPRGCTYLPRGEYFENRVDPLLSTGVGPTLHTSQTQQKKIPHMQSEHLLDLAFPLNIYCAGSKFVFQFLIWLLQNSHLALLWVQQTPQKNRRPRSFLFWDRAELLVT